MAAMRAFNSSAGRIRKVLGRCAWGSVASGMGASPLDFNMGREVKKYIRDNDRCGGAKDHHGGRWGQ